MKTYDDLTQREITAFIRMKRNGYEKLNQRDKEIMIKLVFPSSQFAKAFDCKLDAKNLDR